MTQSSLNTPHKPFPYEEKCFALKTQNNALCSTLYGHNLKKNYNQFQQITTEWPFYYWLFSLLYLS